MKKVRLMRNKIHYDDLALIAGNIAILYKEGISMIMIVDLLKELPLRKSYKDSINGIKEYVLKGESLEKSFKQYPNLYPEFFIGMIAMGEKSGNLYKVLKGLEDYYKVIIFFNNTVKSALSYPFLILLTTIGLFIFLLLFVIPNLYEFYINLNNKVPLMCEISYRFSKFIRENTVEFLIYFLNLIFLVWFLYKYYFKNKFIVLMNKFKTYREFNEFLFISILGIIIKSGINLSDGLICATSNFKNMDLIDRFIALNNNILKGESISDSLISKGNYSKYTVSIIKLGEEGGGIEERLESLTIYLQERLIDMINKKTAIIQPVSILIIGGFVILFLIIFVLPLFSSMYEVAI
ncbi:type II secretion system F family protein [Clostridium sp. Sa3CUN1]|uniref:Type II secretion system F family protein n=1 Tax=Clostridium gallinarum TaxID=2762246 RepID=A0ABR8Q826_9CLOT|nr:type II secretion system F family protein [Clostridium gallinarum]MBD7916583.1 type II secretion system F family protein [Clostridium gallinarum]